MQNFRLSTAHLKFHQICTLIGSLKYKILAKNYRGVISHYPEDWCKIWRKTDLFQKWQEFRKIWPKHSKIYKTCTFICSYCAKYLMFNLKKVQRSYLSWHWMVMQNLKKNWLVVWKMIWGIWQIFTRALQSLKIGTLIRFFNPKKKMYELKIYRAVMCHDNEEWYKIWRGSDLLFQNWHEEFAKFWPEHLKVSKSFILIWPFWAKYMLFELKKCRWVIFHDTEKGYNIWREIDLPFQNWHKELENIWPEHSKVSKVSYIVWAKTLQRSYLSWHWRMMQNLNKKWLVV